MHVSYWRCHTTLGQLLEELFRRDIELCMRGEHLHCSQDIPAGLKMPFRQHEGTILSYLRGSREDFAPFYPLSSAQKAIWFLEQITEKIGAQRMKFEARFLSDIDTGALQQALQSLVDRHASLRTSYCDLDGQISTNSINLREDCQ